MKYPIYYKRHYTYYFVESEQRVTAVNVYPKCNVPFQYFDSEDEILDDEVFEEAPIEISMEEFCDAVLGTKQIIDERIRRSCGKL